MLRELHISNLAIIEQVDIELRPGLNVFTGQTGAGKSLILGALELLLGLRAGGEDAAMMVRPGAAEARVSGVFELTGDAQARRLGVIFDQPIQTDEPLLVTRRVFASGRSSVSVNGAPATAAMLRQAGGLLVDIHGQNDQQVLLRSANQVEILDAFAGATDARRRFADALRELRERQQRLQRLRTSEDERRDKLDLYRYQVDEIDAVDPKSGEYEDLRTRCKVMENAADLKTDASVLLEGLSDGEDSVLDRLAVVRRRMHDLEKTDPGLANLAEQLAQAEDILQEAGRDLWKYQDGLDVDAGELAAAESRLDELNRILHKYARAAEPGTDPVDVVLAYRQRIGQQVEQLESDAQALDVLDAQIAESRQKAAALGVKLSKLRRKAAGKLTRLVEGELASLEMPDAQFVVDVQPREIDAPGVDSNGLDELEFCVRTNPGQELLPLRKIASGGEMSRIMLALKTILADADEVGSLVFDEIDANIGDRLGATIGGKLKALAAGRQILCVTHLSQIAAAGDHHLKIAKDVVDGAEGDRQTATTVRPLQGEARVAELAEMMAGQNATRATRTHARNLLKTTAVTERPSLRVAVA